VRQLEHIDPNGTPWTFSERTRVRRDDTDQMVVIVAASPFETRVIRCERARWDAETPDLAALLAESLPSGASRGSHQDVPEPSSPDEELP
jgi:hypothetical protein